jgi:hypothetical protein
MLAAFLLLMVILAVLARIVPEMNILFISLPLRVGLGLLMAAAFLPFDDSAAEFDRSEYNGSDQSQGQSVGGFIGQQQYCFQYGDVLWVDGRTYNHREENRHHESYGDFDSYGNVSPAEDGKHQKKGRNPCQYHCETEQFFDHLRLVHFTNSAEVRPLHKSVSNILDTAENFVGKSENHLQHPAAKEQHDHTDRHELGDYR